MVTKAQEADSRVRRHLAAIVLVAQEGSDADIGRLFRAETCRLVSAICTALMPHRIDTSGECEACRSATCGLRDGLCRTLLPIRIP